MDDENNDNWFIWLGPFIRENYRLTAAFGFFAWFICAAWNLMVLLAGAYLFGFLFG